MKPFYSLVYPVHILYCYKDDSKHIQFFCLSDNLFLIYCLYQNEKTVLQRNHHTYHKSAAFYPHINIVLSQFLLLTHKTTSIRWQMYPGIHL